MKKFAESYLGSPREVSLVQEWFEGLVEEDRLLPLFETIDVTGNLKLLFYTSHQPRLVVAGPTMDAVRRVKTCVSGCTLRIGFDAIGGDTVVQSRGGTQTAIVRAGNVVQVQGSGNVVGGNAVHQSAEGDIPPEPIVIGVSLLNSPDFIFRGKGRVRLFDIVLGRIHFFEQEIKGFGKLSFAWHS